MNSIEEAWLAFTQDDYPTAEHLFKSIIKNYQDESVIRQAQFGLGYVLAFTQQFEEARAIFLYLHDDAKKRGAVGEQHRALHQVGMVERMAGNWLQAKITFTKEAELIEQLGNLPLPVAVNAYEQGFIALHLNELELAYQWLNCSLEQAEYTDDQVAVGCAYRALGDYFKQIGEIEQAQHRWESAKIAFSQANDEKAMNDIQERLKDLNSSSLHDEPK